MSRGLAAGSTDCEGIVEIDTLVETVDYCTDT